MHNEKEYLKTAAKLLGGTENDTGLLDFQLAEELDYINSMIERTGGALRSRQAIAIAISNWQDKNPGRKAIYFD